MKKIKKKSLIATPNTMMKMTLRKHQNRKKKPKKVSCIFYRVLYFDAVAKPEKKLSKKQ